MQWKTTAAIALSAIGLAIGLPVNSKASLVTNGSFEQNTGNGQIGKTTTATGWSMHGGGGYTFLFAPGTADVPGANGQYGNLSLWGPANGSNNGLPATSPDGGYFIAQDSAFQQAAIQQTVNGLIVGNKYDVGFYWGLAQQHGFDGGTWDNWQVSLGGETHTTNGPFTSVNRMPSHGFSGWYHETMTFTATSTSELLAFYATGGPNGVPPFALLDGVTLDQQTNRVPAPSNLIASMILFGMFGSVWAYKRVRQPAMVA